MRHNKHLHIAEQDPIADWLVVLHPYMVDILAS